MAELVRALREMELEFGPEVGARRLAVHHGWSNLWSSNSLVHRHMPPGHTSQEDFLGIEHAGHVLLLHTANRRLRCHLNTKLC